MDSLPQSYCAYCGAESQGAKYCCMGCESLDGTIRAAAPIPSAHKALDLPQIKGRYHILSGSFDYRLHVEGLHCASCVHLIEKLPEFDTSIKEARVNFGNSSLSIKVQPEFSLAHLLDLLNSWGYPAYFLAFDENSDQKIQAENKSLLKKLAITGACAGNIMLFVIPIYAGLEGSWKNIFNWMSFLLFLPVVFYSGIQFYQGAWNSLRYRIINVDLPITIALLSGFFLSTFNLVRGNGAIYFDSTASFIFLILCARYYLRRSQQKFLSQQFVSDSLTRDHYLLILNDKEKTVAAQDLQVGDRIRLQQGQTCPIDGLLESSAQIDSAVMNGEPLPRAYEAGMKILAGSKNLSKQVDVTVTASYDSTYLSSLLNELRSRELSKSNFTSLTDKAAQWLISAVSFISLFYFLLNFQSDFQEAFNRSLALIVLACPCALAFGAPLTLNLALRKAQDLGILIKDSRTMEKLWSLQHIFFDKTGTLTSLELQVTRTSPEVLSPEVKSIILGLERQSDHPIAFALRDFCSSHKAIHLKNLKEEIGVGVFGEWNHSSYELIQNKEESNLNEISIALYKDGVKICSLFLNAPLKPEAPEVLEKLRDLGVQSHLISGDTPDKAKSIGQMCKIPKEQIHGGFSAFQKSHLVSKYESTCMIGDGSNDALALQSADVGIAVKGSTYVNLQAADIYFTHEGLRALLDLLSLAQKTRRVLFRNLVFALLYNLVGGSLALLGYVDPWLAAVLMPASSMLIISSTLWGFR